MSESNRDPDLIEHQDTSVQEPLTPAPGITPEEVLIAIEPICDPAAYGGQVSVTDEGTTLVLTADIWNGLNRLLELCYAQLDYSEAIHDKRQADAPF